MSRSVTAVVLLVLAVSTAFAGRDLKSVKERPLTIDEGRFIESPSVEGGSQPVSFSPNAITWFEVDSMANAFGPASGSAKAMAYDPATNTLAVIHRGGAPYAIGSGQLWYNISRDGGLSWRRVSELNAGTPASLRYPSCAISNPTGSSDTSNALFVWSAPNLENAGAFGQISYGVDFPLGGGSATASTDAGTNDFTASTTIWGSPNSPWIYWATSNFATNNDSWSWRTTDYTTVTSVLPPTWAETPNWVNALGHIVGKATNTASYYSVSGVVAGDTLALAFNAAYSKTTDNGTTWSGWNRPAPDWMAATGLEPRYDLMDYVQPPGGTVSYDADMVVDANDRVHFVHAVVDSPWTDLDPRGLLEVYETGTGWGYKWITQDLHEQTVLVYPGNPVLAQTNNNPQMSISPDGTVMTMIWVDGTPTDTLADIWFSWREINGANWSTPVNLTETPGYPELLLHTAPLLKSNGANSYTLFIGRSYQTGLTTYPPDNTLETSFFVGGHTFTAISSAVGEEPGTPADFRLSQNYPNPFNPATMIEYTVKQAGVVSLKVFNTLGQEVATLLDGNVVAGTHQVRFDGASLPSGVYVYRMQAGSYSE
jgi:hypothetical protein